MSEFWVLNRPVTANAEHSIELAVDNPIQVDQFNDMRVEFLADLRRRTGHPRLNVQPVVTDGRAHGQTSSTPPRISSSTWPSGFRPCARPSNAWAWKPTIRASRDGVVPGQGLPPPVVRSRSDALRANDWARQDPAPTNLQACKRLGNAAHYRNRRPTGSGNNRQDKTKICFLFPYQPATFVF